jgi:predicted ATPase/DNA-binding SARP family transcriptional activator
MPFHLITFRIPWFGQCASPFGEGSRYGSGQVTAGATMEQELRVRVLGGTELAVGGRPLMELASAKATALLVYLAVTGGAHARSAVAGLLWSDLPEATARANLRLVLTKLRRALPDHLEVDRRTVALAPGRPVWVDAVEVARLAAAERGGDQLLAAVRLCRGEFLRGFEVPGAPLFDEWLVARRAACRAEMLALMDRALVECRDRDDPAAGVEVARRMLELEPLQEEAHRALMWFLVRGGQRSAALAQFDTCRYVLREELGIEPSAATLTLREEIAGAGGFTELGGPGPAARRRPDRPPRTARDLPQPPTALVGRERELARLHDLLDDPACRLVTLVGPGGIGKTRLAVEVAAASGGRHRDGTAFVSFVGTLPARPEEAADVMVANLAAALGVSLAVPRDPLDLLAEHLAGRELLLVLDNLEQLRDAAGVVADLLRRAPGVQVVVTSRRRLGLGVEWLVEVPGLPHPEAVQLFEARAGLVAPDFRWAADPAGVARVCRLLAGVPLAIELAVRWVRTASPSAIADRVAGGLDLLATAAPDVEPRHRSLRSVIDWSWELLTEQERRVLARLSVLRGGFDLEAAAAVAGATLPVLDGLLDHSLVEIGEDGRYGMHELLRQYAAERLAADPEEEEEEEEEEEDTRRRHAEHYAALLPAPADTDDDGGPRLDAEMENLRAATDWMVRQPDPTRLDAYLVRLWALYRRKGWFLQAQAAFGAALERQGTAPLQRARWHRMLGEAHQQLGEASQARHHLERALATLGGRVPASTAGWLDVLATQVARRTLGRLRLAGPVERRPDRRAAATERATAAFWIMEVYWVLEEQVPMLPVTLWSLNEAERAGDQDLIVRAQAGTGMILGTVGLRRLARRHLRAASAAVERTDDPFTACWVGIVGGLHWTGVGDWAAVEDGAARALPTLRRTPMHRWADEMLLIVAIACYLTARYREAVEGAAEGMASGRDRRDPIVHLWGLVVLLETALRADPENPAIAGWSEEAARLLPHVARIDAARFHAAAARLQLAAGRAADAWQATRTADRLMGPEPSFVQYGLEAHAAVAEVCLALLERGEQVAADPAELRATAARGLRRLRRYARSFPMARPRALTCLGWSRWQDGRRRQAVRAWTRAVREAERLVMPYELARAHYELGRHLRPGERSPLRLDGAGHLSRAAATFASIGCRADHGAAQAIAV